MLRCLRIPYSTNVERVALGAGHKGIAIEWIDVPASDRSEVERISGQPLVPVLLDGNDVVADSTVILRRLEALQPEPRLWPTAPAERAQVDVFLEWFNLVWKGPPNEIADAILAGSPDPERLASAGARLRGWQSLFEALLDGRDFLLGDALTAADCAAFPFLKFGLIPPPADDDEVFHAVLVEHLRLDGTHPRLEAWIR